MAMKVFSTVLRAPELESYHQMEFNFITRAAIFLGMAL